MSRAWTYEETEILLADRAATVSKAEKKYANIAAKLNRTERACRIQHLNCNRKYKSQVERFGALIKKYLHPDWDPPAQEDVAAEEEAAQALLNMCGLHDKGYANSMPISGMLN